MAAENPLDRLKDLWKKYRYAAAVVLAGILLMVLPGGHTQKREPPAATAQTREETLEVRLEQLLSLVEGAGRVRVVLTEEFGKETAFQTDTSSDDARQETDTVLVENSARNETGLIRRVDPPTYRGAVIVCQGGNVPGVRLALTQAVSRLTGLRTDQISVLKMK